MEAVCVLFLQKDGVISSGAWSGWRSDQESGPPLVFSFETALSRARRGLPGFVAVGKPPSFPPQAMPPVDVCLQPRTRTQGQGIQYWGPEPQKQQGLMCLGIGPAPPSTQVEREASPPVPGAGMLWAAASEMPADPHGTARAAYSRSHSLTKALLGQTSVRLLRPPAPVLHLLVKPIFSKKTAKSV